MHREDQRVLARIVVEDRLGRRVGEDAAVPVELAVDAHRRKRRRQRAGRHDVLDADLAVAAVEVSHLAGAHMRGADGEPRLARVDQREVDQLAAASFPAARSNRSRRASAPSGTCVPRNAPGLGSKKAGMPRSSVFQYAIVSGNAGPGRNAERRPIGHARPEFLQLLEALAARIAGDQARIDRADRGADDPVRLDAVLVQRVIDAGLIGAERAAALQHQNDLALAVWLRVRELGDVVTLSMISSRDVVARLPACRRRRLNARSSRRPPAAPCR